MPFPGDITDTMNRIKERYSRDFSTCYNYDMYYGWNDCGVFDWNSDKGWAP